MDRREFTAIIPSLLAAVAILPEHTQAQTAPAPTALKTLTSGTFKPGPAKVPQAERVSHAYTAGMLKAGNIRLEMHETIQKPGAQHEPIGTHKHNEIWCIQRGTGTLYINGTEHPLEAGDTGLVCAGDEHWIKNTGDTEFAYFVITVGPPE